MHVLGLSAFYHDSAAALVEGGRIVAAAQEERFTRRKHDSDYPANAIACCLDRAGVTLGAIDRVAFYDKPFLKFERLLETCVAFAPRGFRSFSMAVPVWIKEKLFQKDLLRRKLRALAPEVDWDTRLLFAEHHQSHAASAFYPSPFHDAVVLTMDGVGEWATTSVGIGHGNALEMVREIHFPHSLGLLYSAFTFYIGFKVNSGEYKVMGLAPYREPKYARTILDTHDGHRRQPRVRPPVRHGRSAGHSRDRPIRLHPPTGRQDRGRALASRQALEPHRPPVGGGSPVRVDRAASGRLQHAAAIASGHRRLDDDPPVHAREVDSRHLHRW